MQISIKICGDEGIFLQILTKGCEYPLKALNSLEL